MVTNISIPAIDFNMVIGIMLLKLLMMVCKLSLLEKEMVMLLKIKLKNSDKVHLISN